MGRRPDIEQTQRMYAVYQDGKPCSKVAILFDVTRQSVWDRFKRQGYKLRPSSRSLALPFVDFEGARFAPEKDGYFRKTTGDRQHLHHAIWIKAHGRIIRGWVVRFVDGDRMNVVLENLESVPKNEVSHRKSVKIKPCISCGQLMGRRLTGNFTESPSAHARRKTCNVVCSAEWKKGRRRGVRMPGNHYPVQGGST